MVKVPFKYSISKKELDDLADRAEKNIKELNKVVLEGLRPPAGPYAFFNHNSHALHRLEDCRKILNRLYRQRYLLVELAVKRDRIEPKDWPAGTPYPDNVQQAMKQEHKINGLTQLDMESFYIFGGILLDQWAIQAMCVANLSLRRKHPFIELLNFFEDGNNSLLDEIWDKLKKEMLWLHYQLRFYRNRFIVHANRPWQRGTTRSVYGEDYNLHTPTPPGWIDDKKIDEEIKTLIHLAPDRIQNVRDDYWEKNRPGALIERIFDNIGNIERKEDREKVARIFAQKGGSTPTFQVLAKNLLFFITESMAILYDLAKSNLNNINLGRPHMTSKEMWESRDKK